MTSPTKYSPTSPFGTKKAKANKSRVTEASSLLRSEIAHLWPTITTITTLQKLCTAELPQLFSYCQVLHLEKGQLVLTAPNSAFASKLKQQLPKLQEALQKAGWQVDTIRIKVQINQTFFAEPPRKQCHFSNTALQAFDALEKNLAQSRHNEELLDALRTLLERHKNTT